MGSLIIPNYSINHSINYSINHSINYAFNYAINYALIIPLIIPWVSNYSNFSLNYSQFPNHSLSYPQQVCQFLASASLNRNYDI